MWFEQMIRQETGCAAYLIGATTTAECLVFDPLWEIDPYVQRMQAHDSRLRYVMDSHIHADHVSGARRLAQATGAELLIPRLAQVTYPATPVADGDKLHMGEVTLEMVHTPGHRPEMMSLLITDHSRSDCPWLLLSADGLLVGDLGRPDLAQEGRAGAYQIFDQTLPRLGALSDYVEVYPGHIAGSTCGRVNSGKASSTVGYERRFNPLMQVADRERFAVLMNMHQPTRPANMRNIEAINRGKRPLTMDNPSVSSLSPQEMAMWLAAGALVLDVRTTAQFAAGHLPGAYHVPLEKPSFEQWVGWILPADAEEQRSLLLVVDRPVEMQCALHKLAFLGLDSRVKGYWQAKMNGLSAIHLTPRQVPQLTAQQVHQWLAGAQGELPMLQVLDVREDSEWEAGHLAYAHHMNFKQLGDRLSELALKPSDPIAVICQSGARSMISCSILLHHGFTQVFNLTGGMESWRAAGFVSR
jgi:glyoxylase-like metal-dependent hydrolase (beta-lactamase superfamily II)/rhodanese-related sulfurtransferase